MSQTRESDASVSEKYQSRKGGEWKRVCVVIPDACEQTYFPRTEWRITAAVIDLLGEDLTK